MEPQVSPLDGVTEVVVEAIVPLVFLRGSLVALPSIASRGWRIVAKATIKVRVVGEFLLSGGVPLSTPG